jgi:serine/threonine-protein kinase RsbW
VERKDSHERLKAHALKRPEERSNYPVRLRTFYSSTNHAMNSAISDVLRMASRCGCIGDDRMDLEIALREALANAITHGNGSKTAKRVFLRCYGSPGNDLLILIRDEGSGFDPEQVPDPREADRRLLHHGRGLLLMRKLMDYVEYRKNGREVLIYKHVSRSGG